MQSFKIAKFISFTRPSLAEKFGFRADCEGGAELQLEFQKPLLRALWANLGKQLGLVHRFHPDQPTHLAAKSISTAILQDEDGMRMFLHGPNGPELFFDLPTDKAPQLAQSILRDTAAPDASHGTH